MLVVSPIKAPECSCGVEGTFCHETPPLIESMYANYVFKHGYLVDILWTKTGTKMDLCSRKTIDKIVSPDFMPKLDFLKTHISTETVKVTTFLYLKTFLTDDMNFFFDIAK